MNSNMTIIFFCAAFFAFAGLATSTNAPARHLGVTIPAGAKRLDANRFQSPRSYEDTKKVFRERFAKSESIKLLGDEINLPHVRAVHYQNLTKNAPFFGINIYLNVQTGLTDIFFLVNESQEEKR